MHRQWCKKEQSHLGHRSQRMEHEQCPDKDLDNKMERKRRPPRCKGGKFEQHLESPKMKLKMKAIEIIKTHNQMRE